LRAFFLPLRPLVIFAEELARRPQGLVASEIDFLGCLVGAMTGKIELVHGVA